MNSRVSWSIEGIDSSVRERAEAAARRAGMSLNDWLESAIGAGTSPDFRHAVDHRLMPPSREASEVADIHQRLDAITRQIEQMSRRAQRYEAAGGAEQGVAYQLNDAISRLDARLSQISSSQIQRQAQAYDREPQTDPVERAAAQLYGNAPPLSPASLDVAVAEIAARQVELEAAAAREMTPRPALQAYPPAAPAAPPAPPAPSPTPDFSSLERHLLEITSQIEALQHPDDIERSIAEFRSELAEIRRAITEAMPRRAIESIETEIRALSRRIEENRRSATDTQQLAGIERALSEIREVLGSLMPAEQLAGYDDAIRNLGAKLDTMLRANDDPATVQQLEAAIEALRAIVSNVASNDALVRLSDDVLLLSAKVDQLTRAADHSDNFTTLGHRLEALASTLEGRPQSPGVGTEHLESAMRELSERLDRMEVGSDVGSTLAHLEQRVAYLLERLEATAGTRSGDLGRVEAGLHDILRQLERQQTTFAALAESGARRASEQQEPALIEIVKQELTDIRFSQTETNRHTQDSLEAVHNALGHVVDRLAMIEGDLRTARPATPPAAAPAVEPDTAAQYWPTSAQQPKPELPNPAASQAAFSAAPREFGNAGSPAPAGSSLPPKAISEILEPQPTAAARAVIAPDLPPDHPLEPGTRPTARTSAERIAASENAISEIPAASRPPVSSSSFIAAARRAAQAAAAQAPAEKARVETSKNPDSRSSSIRSRIRSVLVGASVVVIVLSTFKFAMTLLDGDNAVQPPAIENSKEPQAQPPSDPPVTAPDQLTPSMTSPTPIGKQSLNTAPPGEAGASVNMPLGDASPLSSPIASNEITGSLPFALTQPRAKLETIQVPPGESLPDAIGGTKLRTAALQGDPRAAYEVGVRFAEGKGVASNFEEAAKWYDRAAQAGVAPASFRLGTLYEKGLGLKRDLDLARRYYLQAAERGSAKAMHNLAVLEADGGGRGANYRNAAEWFRKAADRGVADSQFNLGILYARGIGVEQNLAEAFKWFSLAAAQGDADAARKRDDIAKRLDAQSLAAAKLAIQTFTAEPQPDEAVNVVSPPGGWDAPPTAANPVKSAAKPALIKRASR